PGTDFPVSAFRVPCIRVFFPAVPRSCRDIQRLELRRLCLPPPCPPSVFLGRAVLLLLQAIQLSVRSSNFPFVPPAIDCKPTDVAFCLYCHSPQTALRRFRTSG